MAEVVPETAGIPERLARARQRVERAAERAGRDPAGVQLLLATKMVTVDDIRAALEADYLARERNHLLRPVVLGENRVQELVAKAPALIDAAPPIHLIGPLQSNKVNATLRWSSCVQSVGSMALANNLSTRTSERPDLLDVYLQVNVSGESTKHGVEPEGAVALARAVGALDGLRLTGLMTVGAHSSDERLVRRSYALLRRLRDAILDSGAPGTGQATELSMGMSGDLEIAIAEGATMVRLGSAVFRARQLPLP